MLGVDFGGFWGVFMWFFEAFSKVVEVDSRRKFQGNSHGPRLQDTSKKIPKYLETWVSDGAFYVILTLFLCYSYVILTLA